MLALLQNPVKPLSLSLSKTLNPPCTNPLIFSFPQITTITTKPLCQSKTSFPPLATSSTSPSHLTPGTNSNSNPLKSIRNPKKQTKSVISGHDKARDLSAGNDGKATVLKGDSTDLDKEAANPSDPIPSIKPRKPRRGRRSEAQATEDFIRNQLEQTLTSIRVKNPGLLKKKGKILKEKPEDPDSDGDGEGGSDEERENEEREKKGMVEEEDPEWPMDAEVGWGIRASDYFEKHPIRNVVENGVEIDWEGEIDEGWVQEINCLEWESFAFHPSPLVVLVFQRYKW